MEDHELNMICDFFPLKSVYINLVTNEKAISQYSVGNISQLGIMTG